MDYELVFWKYKDGIYKNNQRVYTLLSRGEEVYGIEDLPVEDILEDIAEVFQDWKQVEEDEYEKANSGFFQFLVTKNFVRFNCYQMDENDMNKFIDIMSEYDCPLYDPQENIRFDERNEE